MMMRLMSLLKLSEDFFRKKKPVSYTHLDVYKRQIIRTVEQVFNYLFDEGGSYGNEKERLCGNVS